MLNLVLLCYNISNRLEAISMSFFLKKTNNKKGTYLQIYEGFYDPSRGHTAQRSYRPIGYVHELIEQGIEDPLTYFDEEIKQLNLEKKFKKDKEKIKHISEETPEKHLGHYLLKSVHDDLGVKNHLDLIQELYDFNFNAYDVLSSLIYSRVIYPASKLHSFHHIVPKLYENYTYSKDQMYRAIEYFGLEHQKIIQVYNHFVQEKFGFDTTSTYFDCTNFYFEIDKEDAFRRKGPSKENRNNPIVGMGLLLDKNQIPIGMNLYPGNESEVQKLPEIIKTMKDSHNIKGKTVRVADKGLNTAGNIIDALSNGDGYIFSKSIKKLPEVEKTWVLLEHDYFDVLDNDGNLRYKYKECIDKFPYRIKNENGKIVTIELKEKRIVTYTPSLAKKQKREILKQVEKAKRNQASQAKRDEYGYSAKFVTFESTDDEGQTTEGKVKVSINQKAIDEALSLVGYNMIITSEVDFSAAYTISTYRNLWRIEESFRVMKTHLDAQPVHMQKEASIIGHFLICYLSVLLLRLLQFKIFEDKFSSGEIIDFIRNFKVVELSPRKYMNLTKASSFASDMSKLTNQPTTLYYLTKGQVNGIINHRFLRP